MYGVHPVQTIKNSVISRVKMSNQGWSQRGAFSDIWLCRRNSSEQKLDRQLNELEAYGCEDFIIEKESGVNVKVYGCL